MHGKKRVVLYDLDSTIFDTRARWCHSPVKVPGNTWEDYSLACETDEPLWGTVLSMRLHYEVAQVHICSGRDEVARGITERMLLDIGAPYDHLQLRTEPEHRGGRKGIELKVEYIEALREQGLTPVLFYEDWPDVASAIHERTGVPVLCVNPLYGNVQAQEGGLVST
jgi:hypothetical protein